MPDCETRAGAEPAAVKLLPSCFRGDFAQLSALMQRTWEKNQETPLLYTETLLESTLGYPGTDRMFSPCIYDGDRLLAFVTGLPRRFLVNGQERRILLTTFLTADPEQRNARYGLTLWREIYQRARSAGYDGALSLCVEGDDMNRIVVPLGRVCHFNTRRIFTVDYLTRFLRPAQETVTACSDEEVDLFLKLASAVAEAVPFARVWSRSEALWQCRLREGALTISACHDGRRGMLSGYLVWVASKPAVKALAVEDVFWGDLESAERVVLTQKFMSAAASLGAKLASCPVMNYADLEPLRAAGFRAAKRRIHVYLTSWNGLEPAEYPSVYMDVL
ncbi:MAG: GNAT family N-acetyltransferase [Acidobacteriaceae bacterium]|nr:GNAT family N-acetyltransferase [Acidobacteriaceae bacterium]